MSETKAETKINKVKHPVSKKIRIVRVVDNTRAKPKDTRLENFCTFAKLKLLENQPSSKHIVFEFSDTSAVIRYTICRGTTNRLKVPNFLSNLSDAIFEKPAF